MKNAHLVIETTNILGRVAYVKSVSPSENILGIKNAISISAYASKKQAQAQADMLNKLYKGEVII